MRNKHKKRKPTAEQLVAKQEIERQQSLFFKNAFLFLENTEAILANPRMAYTPVPFKSGTAQTGLFRCQTLGVYVEWWQSSEYAIHIADDGRKALTYEFVGSLLSGVNSCGKVYEDGTTENFSYKGTIGNVCRSFFPICMKYCERKEDVVPYSLDEVIESFI